MATALTAAGSAMASSSPTNATSGPDLSMTGSVVAGVKTVQAALGTQVAMSFRIKNRSSSQSADISFNFSFVNTPSPGLESYECPLVSTHLAINADSPSCEPGTLGAGKSAQAAVIVVPQEGTTSMSVKACATNLSGATDPTPSNNCKTLTVAVEP